MVQSIGLMLPLISHCGRIFLRASRSPERVKPCMSVSTDLLIRYDTSLVLQLCTKSDLQWIIRQTHQFSVQLVMYRAVDLVAVSVRVKFAGWHILR